MARQHDSTQVTQVTLGENVSLVFHSDHNLMVGLVKFIRRLKNHLKIIF